MERWNTFITQITDAPEAAMIWTALNAAAAPLAVFVIALVAARVGPAIIARRAPAPLARFAPRARTPLTFIALALAAGTAGAGAPPDSVAAAVFDVARGVFAVMAAGWLFERGGDYMLRRAAKQLDLTAEDNLDARRRITRLGVMRRIWTFTVIFFTAAAVLLTLPPVRELGLSLFASAGVVGIVVGVAARPVLANIIAGVQIALTQPIRIDDAVVVEGEWGWVEEIGLTYVVVRLWDWRRLVLPVSYFVEKPFQNWTRESASILGSVFWRLDYRAPVEAMRAKLDEILEASTLWDRKAKVLQVTDVTDHAIEIRALASARSSPQAFDLRCEIREKMIAWLQAEHPEVLPRVRAELTPISPNSGEDARTDA